MTWRQLGRAVLMSLGMWAGLAIAVECCHAASVRVCWDDASTINASTVPGLVGTVSLSSDLLIGSNVLSGKRCSTVPLPAGLARNTDLPVTVIATNAIGEVSPASNAVTFRVPSAPTVPTSITVQIVAGP